MKLGVFSIYDQQAKVYNVPFYSRYKGEASRSFLDLASDGKSTVSLHRDDYILYQVGEYEDETGRLESLQVPELVIRGSELQVGIKGV